MGLKNEFDHFDFDRNDSVTALQLQLKNLFEAPIDPQLQIVENSSELLPVAFRQPLADDLYLLVNLFVVIRQPMADELVTYMLTFVFPAIVPRFGTAAKTLHHEAPSSNISVCNKDFVKKVSVINRNVVLLQQNKTHEYGDKRFA